jgi:glutamate dehydrogenase
MTVEISQVRKCFDQRGPTERLDQLSALAELVFAGAAPEFLNQFTAPQLAALVRGVLDLLDRRGSRDHLVRVYDPEPDLHGWSSPHSAIEIALGDRPFIIDSVRLFLKRQGIGLHHLLHPILGIERDSEGVVTRIFPPDSSTVVSESYELFLIDRAAEASRRREIAAGVEGVLNDVVVVTDDFPAMRDQCGRLRALLMELAERGLSPAVPESPELVREYADFLKWLEADHFIFLGYRKYDLFETEGRRYARVRRDSGLGILRDPRRSHYIDPVPVESLPEKVLSQMSGPPLLLVTKANSSAPVRRDGLMDYVGLKRFDDKGQLIKEHRFLGLFASRAYATPVAEIPILRRKLKTLLELDRAKAGSHDFKRIVNIVNSIPLPELFLLPEADLHRDVRNIMSIEKERGVRLQIRLDPLKRGVVVMVIMPRERFNSDVRSQIQSFLAAKLGATSVDYRLAMAGGDEDQARFHFIFTTSINLDDVDLAALEQEVADLTRTWDDLVREALGNLHGERGDVLAQKYLPALTEGFKAEVSIESAVLDIENLDALGDSAFRVELFNPTASRFPERTTHLRLYHPGTLSLTEIFPVLESLGLKVFEQISYQLTPPPEGIVSIDIFRVQDDEGEPINIDRDGDRLKDALLSILTGRSRIDRLNRLVLRASLPIREVGLLMAYRGYLFQLIPATSLSFVTDTLLRYPEFARAIHDYFKCRFDPNRDREGGERRMAEAHLAALASLNLVSTLPEDEILRFLVELVDKTVRTNFYQRKDWISIKVETYGLERIAEPRPRFEIFVFSPHVEAIHLRGGKIARGGLRWSDRPDDFRTEVLGLMKTQMTKNALIVPVGSKGGFVLKNPPADLSTLKAHVKEQYRTFIRGMLDLTDNLVDSRIVRPAGVVAYDEDDPYLVVAADKGTATFSDTANEISREYGFWLGDAFASGGSHGYDHKREGITARGAWECVKRHFRELDLDPMRDEFTAVGVGDMSGDVFGNGLLYTDRLRLLAAFNHLHIFVDPNPDARVGHAERSRLFRNPSLTWQDYDRNSIGNGGGVFFRHAKAIPLSPQVKELLGIEDETISGQDLVRHILRLRVDLLWNGGIGTYVKSSAERNADVRDPANDAVRVDASELGARVVGEGGNLGLTQLARIEYALSGGRINTDAIDNSGGVDMSDHEVNIKILLEPEVALGRLGFEDRNALLRDMTGEVVRLVLENNYTQVLCLSLTSRFDADAHARLALLQESLAREGLLKPDVEFLPSPRDVEQRHRTGLGFTRPELAVLLAYVKMGFKRSLLDSSLPDEGFLERYLYDYFPKQLRDAFHDRIRLHPLRREIVATRLTNLVVDRLGLDFLHGIMEETAASSREAIRALLAAHEILDLKDVFDRIFALDEKVRVEEQYRAIDEIARSTKGIVDWLILSGTDLEDLSPLVDKYRDPMLTLRRSIQEYLPARGERKRFLARKQEASRAGFPGDLASDLAAADYFAGCMGVIDVSRSCGAPIDRAAREFFALGDLLELGWLRDQLSLVRPGDRWEAVAVKGLVVDLRRIQQQLTLRVLTSNGSSLRELAESERNLFERITRTLEEMRERERVNLAGGAVVTRLIMQLLERLDRR